MRIRYTSNLRGKLARKAEVYTQKEHRIPPESVDPDAARVIGRLRRAGHTAYIVGGAIRDLLLGRRPKDFDIATDAHPRRIRRLFANSRIIGRRFRIVHIFFPGPKIFEVTTFRANPVGFPEEDGSDEEAPDAPETPEGNEFGTIEEDAWRRDFTINALYYDPFERTIIDYVGGLKDIRERRIRTLIPVEASFLEDPVRMIRAVRYAGQTGFRLSLKQRYLIRQHRGELRGCSMERITEDVYKILKSGYSAPVLELAWRLKLLEVLMPALNRFIAQGQAEGRPLARLWRLGELDERVRRNPAGEIDRGELLACLFGELFEDWSGGMREEDQRVEEPLVTAIQLLRSVTGPLKPSNREIRVAALRLLGSTAEVPGGEEAPAAGPGAPPRRARRPTGRRPASPRAPAVGGAAPGKDARVPATGPNAFGSARAGEGGSADTPPKAAAMQTSREDAKPAPSATLAKGPRRRRRRGRRRSPAGPPT